MGGSVLILLVIVNIYVEFIKQILLISWNKYNCNPKFKDEDAEAQRD